MKKLSESVDTTLDIDIPKAIEANKGVDKMILKKEFLLKGITLEKTEEDQVKQIYQFQEKSGLYPDGIAGELTFLMLKDPIQIEQTVRKAASVNNINGSNLTELVKGIQKFFKKDETGLLTPDIWEWAKTGGWMIDKEGFSLSNPVSKFYKWSHFIRSADLKEVIEGDYLSNIKTLAMELDKVKEKYPDIIITSGFRSKNNKHEAKLNGKGDHARGCAVDIQIPGKSERMDEIMDWIRKDSGIPFTQIIREYMGNKGGWIHLAVGGKTVRDNNKELIARANDGKINYETVA
jgi:hypothetical protein